MSSIIIVFLLILYYLKLSISITIANKHFSLTNHRYISTTSYPLVLQIPSPPRVLQTTTKPTIVHSNHEQYGNADENSQTKLEALNDLKYKSLFAMILPIRSKIKPSTFNIDQSPVLLLISSIDSS
ncbi:unnamed protein product [Rotaria sp. Silwood1]|nr:unnamed protein product [Rotaria sp. Silwood1]CAF0993530.1 unnamed protein product [Rotaria sp. Silwood1]CAF3383741.1 unnamed protein product [Rotaria sp. Silwood1]CAF3420443.1 unnamed protein product [Rotaria sp. Silwood1]CAF4533947.1 unnamed protein product [Rotaria sp. Silwood1]